jgi:hypothetical protein
VFGEVSSLMCSLSIPWLRFVPVILLMDVMMDLGTILFPCGFDAFHSHFILKCAG